MVIDGAHNEDSAEKLFAYATQRFVNLPLWSLFGAGNENWSQTLLKTCQNSQKVVLVQCQHFKAKPVTDLAAVISDANKIHPSPMLFDHTPNHTVKDNLEFVLETMPHNAILIVCGSLFVASEVRFCLKQLNLFDFAEDDWVHQQDEFVLNGYK